ncbi:hypothetical protein [Hymenobacter coccineus]|uniref:Outer membrane protein beta-barrel domain-containing protein n=1 Tax=Hymenobacter coccineus TaxID=1908235 RepID=A0A1G1TER0_9BACT|nr:hypothetical protein [Hymenobacter coccineus]OGX89364.1 hypothetical protein BEN49_09060 [Hymenobacter coccineus]
MKKLLLFAAALAVAAPATAQHFELIGRAGASFSQYRGSGTEATSFINYSSYAGAERGYTNNPYGSRLGTGFALGGRVQRVGRRRGLLAFDLGYDWARSRTAITTLYYYDGAANTAYTATGSAHLRSQDLTAFLGLGHRFQLGPLALDALVGPELAAKLSARETGHGTYNSGTAWATATDRGGHFPLDGRLRADATVWCGRVGVNASYSHGFANAQAGLIGGPVREAYTRTLRWGLAYRLR